MAQGKKSVLLYCDIIHTVEKLDNETAGQLFKHYLRYINDQNPTTENAIVDIVFEPIKQSLKRDLKKYGSKLEERSLSGRLGNLKRWHPDLHKRYEKGELSLVELEDIAKHRKTSLSDNSDSLKSQTVANVADSVSVSVSDSVRVSDNDRVILLKKETKGRFKPPTLSEVENHVKLKNYKTVNASSFWNFYESKNWFVGKNKMKDWKKAMAGWESRSKGPSNQISEEDDNR